jgi:hypothetical protein
MLLYFQLQYVAFPYVLFLYNSFIYARFLIHFFLLRCFSVGYIRETPGSNLGLFIGYFDMTFVLLFLNASKEVPEEGAVIGHDHFQFMFRHSS